MAKLASQLPKTIAITKQQDQQADGVTSESDVIVVQAREKVNATVPMPTEPVSQTLTTEESLETSEATLMDLSLIDIALSNAINEGLLDQVFEGRESV